MMNPARKAWRSLPVLLFLLLALLAASACVDLSAASAGTGGQPDHCKEKGWSHSAGGDDWHVYLKVCWNDMPKGGVELTDVQERVDPGFWETTAVACTAVVVDNDQNVQHWVDTGASCNIPRNLGYRVYDNLSAKMPSAAYATATFAGRAHLDGSPDADVRISFNFG